MNGEKTAMFTSRIYTFLSRNFTELTTGEQIIKNIDDAIVDSTIAIQIEHSDWDEYVLNLLSEWRIQN